MKCIVPLRFDDWHTHREQTLATLENAENSVDMLEIWLDQGTDEQVAEGVRFWKSHFQGQLFGVCKTPAEKGSFSGTAEEKLKRLQQFLAEGGDFVDGDIDRFGASFLRELPAENLWVSFHDFEGVPENLEDLLDRMKALHPYLVKMAVTPQTEKALQKFMTFIESLPVEIRGLFTTMGELGQRGREQIATLDKSFAGFWALDQDHTTASGQPVLS